MQDLVFKLAGSSKNEILGIFSTSNAFHRQESMGMVPKLQQLKEKNDKLRIRILAPFDDYIALISQKLRNEFGIEIMNLEESLRIRASILLVDRNFVTYTELKDDTKKPLMKQLACLLFLLSNQLLYLMLLYLKSYGDSKDYINKYLNLNSK